jgi:hypothetical protein
MERNLGKNDNDTHYGHAMQVIEPVEKIPMHPDDFNALLAWITAKRFHEAGAEHNFAERSGYAGIIG